MVSMALVTAASNFWRAICGSQSGAVKGLRRIVGARCNFASEVNAARATLGLAHLARAAPWTRPRLEGVAKRGKGKNSCGKPFFGRGKWLLGVWQAVFRTWQTQKWVWQIIVGGVRAPLFSVRALFLAVRTFLFLVRVSFLAVRVPLLAVR